MTFLADITTALRLLTVVPSGSRQGSHPVRYFTWIGWLYAAVAIGISAFGAWIGAQHGYRAGVIAVLIVCAWAVLSGCLHLDGLGDCADALGVRGSAARKLAVMRDSTIGAYGVVAIVLVVLLDTSSIAVLVDSSSWWGLAAAPVLGRLGAALALLTERPARTDGLAVLYASRDGALGYTVLLVPCLLLLVSLTASHVLVVLAGVLVTVAVPRFFARRLGGITGDVLGTTVVVTEAAVLAMCALA